VKGTVQLRAVVDAQGMARRITIVQPLGYGLDEKAVEALAKYRFAPATNEGRPVASNVLVNQDYVLVPVPQ
jgi:TonB family protein